jgi:hypothetical protein
MWVKKLRVDENTGFVFSWTFTVACFHRLRDGSRVKIISYDGVDRE